MRRRRLVAVLAVAAVVAAGCTGDPATSGDGGAEAGAPSDDEAGAPSDDEAASPSPTDESGPELAEPSALAARWASTVGLPVVGAVRTSTPLARLGAVPADERPATCDVVAAELDTIAPPQVLTALAVSADPETATLLVGDLRAKLDLLTVCHRTGPDVDALIEEVAATHEVAVAWLQAIEAVR